MLLLLHLLRLDIHNLSVSRTPPLMSPFPSAVHFIGKFLDLSVIIYALFQVRLTVYPLPFSYLVSIPTGREGPQSTGPLAVRSCKKCSLGFTPYMYITPQLTTSPYLSGGYRAASHSPPAGRK
jgi:hypothetical protein